jgi:hypothetical protein
LNAPGNEDLFCPLEKLEEDFLGIDGKHRKQQRPDLSGLNRREKNKKEGGRKMKRGIWLGLVLGLMVLGAASVCSAQGGPVLEKIWVPAEVNHGQLLKIYIKASDPENDIRWVYITAGRGKQTYLGAPTRIKKEFAKDLNGYVWWDTKQAAMKDVTGTVEVMVEDRKGNESEAKSATVKIVAKGAKAETAPGDFKDVNLGPVMVQGLSSTLAP